MYLPVKGRQSCLFAVLVVLIVVLIVILAVLAILIVVSVSEVVVVVLVIVVRHFNFLQWVISYRSSMSKTHKKHSLFAWYFGTISHCFFVTLVL